MAAAASLPSPRLDADEPAATRGLSDEQRGGERAVTLVGESMGLLTRPHKGDITLIAHLAGMTPGQPLPDGTRLESIGNWFSRIILRNTLDPRPGEPLGGAEIPSIALLASADGATRHCDSTKINGAGNQPSRDVGRDGTISSKSNTRVRPGGEKYMGHEKAINVGEVLLALLYYHARTADGSVSPVIHGIYARYNRR